MKNRTPAALTEPAPLDSDAPAFDRPLRVGVLLDSLTAPRWVAHVLRDIVSTSYIDVPIVVVDAANGHAPPPQTWREWFTRQRAAFRYRLWEWYEAADYRRFRNEGLDPFEPIDVAALVRKAIVVRATPERKRFVDRFRAEDVCQVREASLDVLLRFGFRIVKGDILQAARFGTWSLHHGDNRAYRGGPALFWEVYERNPESGVVLQMLTESLDAGRILYRSIGATEFGSVYKNRRATYWKAADVIVRRLRDLYWNGWPYLEALDTYAEPDRYSRGIYRRPTNRQMLTFLGRVFVHRATEHVASRLQEQWVLAARPRGSNRPFRILEPPRDHFYADPFLAEDNGRTWLFFEDYSYRDRKGTIARAELSTTGLGAVQTVLGGEHHLSYPALVPWRGEWLMIPETSARRRVELWRARRFPDEWTLETILMDGLDACDATMFECDGRWWMFVTLCVPGGPRADEVSLFYADGPLGPWTPHRANPVVSDASHARPAGALYREGSLLIRPSQDVRGGYGRAVTLNRIDRLTEREYRETAIGAIRPDWHPRLRGTHTIARSSAHEVVDGRLLRFRRSPC